MSIRLRLSLLYTAILALTLIAFGVALYAIQSRHTLDVLRRDLEINARRLALGIAERRVRLGALEPRSGQGLRPPPGLEPQQLRDLRIRDAVRLLDTDGAPVDHPINDESMPFALTPDELATVQRREALVHVRPIQAERWLVHTNPVIADDDVVAIVQVARSLADRDRSLRGLGTALVAGSLLTTLAAFGIGWVLSGLALQPIHRITQTVQAIGTERDFGRRVQYAGPDDELGQLATAFNDMLAELQDAYQHVERSLELQRGFVADVSHELRTPLTTIRGNLALLKKEPPLESQERADILADMVDETERLIQLVSDLLTLARVEAGPALQAERVALKPLVAKACQQAALLDPGRTVVCDPLLDLAVTADRNALKQVVLILLDNALKHGLGTVHVTAARSDGPDGTWVTTSVRDEGPGIDPKVASRVFARFERGDRTTQSPGLGLGLPIARALTEAMSGTLTLASQPGQGSTFTIGLPLASTQEAPGQP